MSDLRPAAKIRHIIFNLIRDDRLNDSQRRVAIALVDAYNEKKRRAYAGYENLAERANLSRSTVHRCVRTLEGLGLIQTTLSEPGGVNHYKIDFAPSPYELWIDQAKAAKDAGLPAEPFDQTKTYAPPVSTGETGAPSGVPVSTGDTPPVSTGDTQVTPELLTNCEATAKQLE
jgi:hypothetical protein